MEKFSYDGLTHDSGKEFNAQAASKKPTFNDILIECGSLLHARDFGYFYVIENHRSKKLLAVKLNMSPDIFEETFIPAKAGELFEELCEEPGYEGYSYYDYYVETPFYDPPYPVVLFSCECVNDEMYYKDADEWVISNKPRFSTLNNNQIDK